MKTVDIRFKKEAEVSIINEANETIASYDVEISDTPYEQQTGLIYPEDLQKNQGMLFVFEEEAERAFYMKNTLLPLDLLFIDAQKPFSTYIRMQSPTT